MSSIASLNDTKISSTSVAFFSLLALWFTYKTRKRNEVLDEAEEPFHLDTCTIGNRGISTYKKIVPYWEGFMLCLQYPCDVESNPEGYIALCLAENKLIHEELASRLMRNGTAVSAFSESAAYCLQGFLGLPNAREALSSFLTRRFWCKEQKWVGTNPLHHVDSQSSSLNSLNHSAASSEIREGDASHDAIHYDNVAFGAGVHSLLSHLIYILADAGDYVMIPAPYYTGFEYAVKAISQCIPYPVYMENPLRGPTVKDLESSYKSALKQGRKVRVLLLTNPNDPLGVVYESETLKSIVFWGRENKVHIIVDEVYALAIHSPSNDKMRFQSIIRVLDNELGNYVHQLWGFSKDFGASGFRVGTLYSQNIQLLQALANLNIFSGVSHPIQMIVTELLYDDEFVDNFLQITREKLRASYNLVTTKLDEMVIPFVPAHAGLFVYVDFSSLLPEQSFEGEAKLAALIQDVARVVLTPGKFQRDSKPGMFRLCYSWVTIEVLEIAMERLSYVVLQIRRNRTWDDLLQGSWKEEVTKCGTTLSSRRSTMNLTEMVLR